MGLTMQRTALRAAADAERWADETPVTLRCAALIRVSLSIALLSSCAPPKIHTVIAKEAVLRPEGLTLTSETPLEAPNHDNYICMELPEGYELHDDWRVHSPAGEPIDFGGEVTLRTGQSIALSGKFSLGPSAPCLSGQFQEVQRRRDFGISKIRLWSSAPLKVMQVMWHSTDK
jgi:hypothetical protein